MSSYQFSTETVNRKGDLCSMESTAVELVNMEKKQPEDVKEQDGAKSEPAILKPGVKIRPNVSEEQVRHLAERLYGIVPTEIQELKSYDDRNYLLIPDRNIKNPIVKTDWPHGYILKITNEMDSKMELFMSGQTEMMVYLNEQGISCPKPLKNILAKYYSLEKLGDAHYMVRLLQFLPGKVFHEVISTNNLFYQVGEHIAKIDRVLKNFQHDGYKDRTSLWMLESVPKLTEFLYALKDESKKDIVEQVIEAFEKRVLANVDDFEKGMIHGDFNEQNIIVNKSERPNEHNITGVIDFGDTSFSHYVFEVAITMCYMMLQTGEIETGGLVLAGYTSVRHVPEQERKVLKLCVAARLCQSLVLGAYTHTLDPDNDYLLTTQKAGWELLQEVWSTSDEKMDELWCKIADDYLKQSYK